MTRWLAALFILTCVANVPEAAAQTGFIQGGYGTDVRRFSADQGQEVFDGRATHVVIAGGGFVAPRWTVGLELDVGASSTEMRSVSVPIAGRPTTITTSYALERRSVSGLAGFHTSQARRVRLGCYAGLSFSTVRREIAADAPAVVLTPPPEPSVFTDRTTGAIVGIDVAVRVAPHVALVGGLRAQGLALTGELTGFSVRPMVAARLAF